MHVKSAEAQSLPIGVVWKFDQRGDSSGVVVIVVQTYEIWYPPGKIDVRNRTLFRALKAQTVLKNEQMLDFGAVCAKSIPLLTNLFKTNFDIVAKFKTRGASDK
ncbi:hypothetical protein TNCV_2372011 [Trichonephila clavipes]|nr:hypothetical protein TNCV_2372011 [Trichonephila clavipes]